MNCRILYEDRDLMVIYKPAGLAVETKRLGQKDVSSELKNYLANKGEASTYIGIVHRLDQPVEGVMVVARNEKAAASLSRQAAADAQGKASGEGLGKEYLAVLTPESEKALKRAGVSGGVPGEVPGEVLSGVPGGESGGVSGDAWITLEDHLLRDGRSNTSRVVKPGTGDAKKAKLAFCIERVSADGEYLLARVRLYTGRHHQIRVQLANAGLPLRGDTKYNPAAQGGTPALCACSLTFRHPATGKRMTFACEPENPLFAIGIR